jgi:hypothetical protein
MKNKNKVMTGTQATDMGINQAQYMIAGLLFDKFDMSIVRINHIQEYIGRLSDEVNNNTKTAWDYLDWATEHNLNISFSENVSFSTPEMRERINNKIRAKKTTIIFAMYALKKYMKFTYKDLEKLKFHIEDLQDSIDKRVYLTYEDIYKEQEDRGFIPWTK